MSAAVANFDDVLAAAARIAPHATVTPVLRSKTIDGIAGCRLAFKAEHLQRTGAFKFRGACNAAWSIPGARAAAGLATHSSGNHGAALALAAGTRGVVCHVVAPADAVSAKLFAIAAHGAVLHRCPAGISAREAACAKVVEATGATLVHPYADAAVIAGQGTAALELLAEAGPLDAVVVPVGGGGLAAGTAITLASRAPGCRLYLAEPSGAADAHESLERGERVAGSRPETVCDGLRATLGQPGFDILCGHGAEVLLVDDDDTIAAMRLVWQRMKQVVEPSSAIALAAVLGHRARFEGLRVGVVLTGGNVDLDALPWAA